MKILLINNFLTNDGGSEVYTKRLGELLLKNGHEVYYFGTNRKPYFIENIENTELFPEYVKYTSLPKNELYKAFRIFYYHNAGQNILELIEKVKPDIAHCNSYVYGLTFSVLDSLYSKKVPTVLTLHDSHFACPTSNLFLKNESFCNNFLCINNNPLQCIINKCSKGSLSRSCFVTLEYLFRKLNKINEKIDNFVCPSLAIKNLAVLSGFDEKKLHHIENFVDNDLLLHDAKFCNKGYFLYVGRFYKTKGLETLLIAISKINKSIELHLVGSGPEEENLRNLSKELELSNIKFLGYKTGKELANEYEYCSATILPSNYFETFGLTTIESFCYGKPVIGSDVGGIPEIIKNGHNGFIFKRSDATDLAHYISRLYNNPELSLELGKNAKRSVETLYSSDHFYEKINELYEKTISKDIIL